MSAEDRAVVQKFLDAIHAGDQQAAIECLSPEVTIDEDPGLPYAGRFVGFEGLGALVAKIEQCGLDESFDEYRVLDAGDVVISLLHITLTHRSGKSADSRVVEVYRLQDGLIAHIDVFYKNPLAVTDLVTEVTESVRT